MEFVIVATVDKLGSFHKYPVAFGITGIVYTLPVEPTQTL